MKTGLHVGARQETSLVASEAILGGLENILLQGLLGTGALIQQLENLSLKQISAFLESSETAAGIQVALSHTHPARMGDTLTLISIIQSLHGNHIVCAVEAFASAKSIASGTFTVAIVPVERLNSHPSDTSDTKTDDNEPEAPVPAPPPAQLSSPDGAGHFQLELLRWEVGMFPCTRYDEWLVCRFELDTSALEGAFLLQYEVEELQAACADIASGTRMRYQSDYLEPVLQLILETDAGQPNVVSVQITLTPQKSTPSTHKIKQAFHWQLELTALARFAVQIERQLDGFHSRL